MTDRFLLDWKTLIINGQKKVGVFLKLVLKILTISLSKTNLSKNDIGAIANAFNF